MSIRVLIADDHSVIREGLRMFLSLDEEITIVGEAADGVEAIELTRQLKPDVVIMDLFLPELDGVMATRIIRQQFPKTQVIALTGSLNEFAVDNTIRAGAIGFVLKTSDAQELSRTIHAAVAGHMMLPPQTAYRLRHEVGSASENRNLTAREIDVVKLLVEGKSNKEIAGLLGISYTTVKNHLSSIMVKLDLTSRTKIALYAVHSNLVAKRTTPKQYKI